MDEKVLLPASPGVPPSDPKLSAYEESSSNISLNTPVTIESAETELSENNEYVIDEVAEKEGSISPSSDIETDKTEPQVAMESEDSNPLVISEAPNHPSQGDIPSSISSTMESTDSVHVESVIDDVEVPCNAQGEETIEIPPSESKMTKSCHVESEECTEADDLAATPSSCSNLLSDSHEVPVTPITPTSSQSVPSTSSPPKSPQMSAYHIKWIKWNGQKTPIVTQNENGPCPLIAIMNVLLLKRSVTMPPMIEIITASQLMEYLGDCMLENIPKNISESAQLNFEQNMSDAMSILPKLQTGLDVNVKFSGVSDFEYTPECIVFDLLRIPLYHGWLLDPEMPEVLAAVGSCSYNQLVEKIIINKSSPQPEIVTEALLAENFLERTASQLTYHGLCELNATIKEGELCILFRNNHFITLYKHKNELFQLVTDQGFLTESSVVWETLNNIEGDGQFVDSDFVASPPKPPVALNLELSKEQQINQDYLVALSLQEEQEKQEAQQQRWEKFKDTQGLTDLTDEELARRLQERETRKNNVPRTSQHSHGSRSPGAGSGGGGGGGGGTPNGNGSKSKKGSCIII